MEKFLIVDKEYINYASSEVKILDKEPMHAFICSDFHKDMNEFENVDLSIKYALSHKASKEAILAMFEASWLLLNQKDIINNKTIIIGNNQLARDFQAFSKNKEKIIPSKDIKEIKGELGSMSLLLKDGSLLKAHILCSFVGPKYSESSGLIRADRYKDFSSLKQRLDFLSDTSYLPYFEPKYCDECLLCVGACEPKAISFDKGVKINAWACTKCAACISACSNGSLKRKELKKSVLRELIRLFKDQKLFLIAQNKLEELGEINLSKVSMLALPSLNFSLDEYLMIVEELGQSIVFHEEGLSEYAKENIAFVNEISKALFGKNAIFYTKDINDDFLAKKLYDFKEFSLSYNDDELFARQNLALRLQNFVKNEEISINTLKKSFAKLKIADNCTLCMACVSVCKSFALFGSEADEALKFNASYCTNCDKCQKACPEQSISIKALGLSLKKDFFDSKIVAKDERFACIMCKEPFATKKSIEKVAKLMNAKFTGDEKRLKTLYCCPSCKVKVMLS